MNMAPAGKLKDNTNRIFIGGLPIEKEIENKHLLGIFGKFSSSVEIVRNEEGIVCSIGIVVWLIFIYRLL